MICLSYNMRVIREPMINAYCVGKLKVLYYYTEDVIRTLKFHNILWFVGINL